MSMVLESFAFKSGDRIPAKYTCDGENVSPPFTWHGVPKEAQSLALICDDPDASRGVFSHWVLYNLPTGRQILNENIPRDAELPGSGSQGRNDFGEIGYGGPCPPPGSTHHYYFRFYALKRVLDLSAGATRQQVLDRMQEHILDSTEVLGLYTRSS